MRAFYYERSVIEKEYATKLTALSTKYFDKKARMSTALSVGETPVITPGSLESASLVAWSEVLNQTEQIGKERLRMSNEFNLQIAEQVNGIATRFDDLRRRYASYHDKLIEDREGFYSELKKAKAGYDGACEAMESARLKASKSYDRAKDKASRRMVEKGVDMNNEKNTYIIKINVANRVKDKYYHEDVPELLDHLQALNEARVRMVNDFWHQAIQVERGCCERTVTCLDGMAGCVAQNNPALDSAMFVKHNLGSWTEPTDFYFQESPIWHDEDGIATDDVSLQYLRRWLENAQNKLAEHSRTSESRAESYRAVMEQRRGSVSELDSGKISKASYIELLGRTLAALQAVTYNETAKTIVAVEIETIEVAAGDKDLNSVTPVAETKKRKGLLGLLSGGGGSSGHHHHSVQDPVDIDHELQSVRSLSIHSGHQGGGGGGAGGGFLSSFKNTIRKRSGSITTAPTGASQESVGNTNGSIPSTPTTSIGGGFKRGYGTTTGRMLYGYSGQQSGELTLIEGEEFMVVEEDDGTGWVIGRKTNGEEGLIPASYCEIISNDNGNNNILPVPSIVSVSTGEESVSSSARGSFGGGKKKGPSVAPRRGGKKIRYVIAQYDYDATNEEEITIRAGDKIAVTQDDPGDGWTEGELNGMKGSFPSSYVKDVD